VQSFVSKQPEKWLKRKICYWSNTDEGQEKPGNKKKIR